MIDGKMIFHVLILGKLIIIIFIIKENNKMEWRQIVAFHQVMKLGSFTKAANAVFRSQSALSQQISALEDELGCKLFDRIGKKKILLTPYGERFKKFAESVLQAQKLLMTELDEIIDIRKGPLTIAAPFTTLYHLLPKYLEGFKSEFPNIRLTILDRSQREVISLVNNGDVDFGITIESMVPTNFKAIIWKELEVVLLAPKDHPITNATKSGITEIAKYPLILPPKSHNNRNREILEKLFHDNGLVMDIVMESSNVELSSMYAEMGLGLSFATITKGFKGLESRNLTMIPLRQYFKTEHLAIITRESTLDFKYKNEFLAKLLYND